MQKLRTAEIDTLPPVEVRLINPDDPNFVRIDTPTDDRNLVDVPALIAVVQETVDPDYLWPPALSVHHFYWPEADYLAQRTQDVSSNPTVFRNLPLHKGLVPRAFENWLHKITAPSPIPNPDVMRYRVEAWQVARSLFASVQNSVQWERRARRRAAQIRDNPDVLNVEFNGEDIIGEEIIQDILDRFFRGANHQMARLENIPPEHRLFDPNKPREVLAKQLGQLVVPKQLRPTIRTGDRLRNAA